MTAVRILLYAINGIGLGHLTRLLAVARAVRELSDALHLRADLQFVTTSEGSDLVHDFPVYKLPSKTVVSGSGADPRAFVASAKILISNVTAALRPDVLVLDTQPEGAFRELLFVRDFARRTVFIDRLRNPAAARDRTHQSHLALYDRIIVPDTPERADLYPLSPHLQERRRFVGRVHGYREQDAWDAARVRAYFAVPEDQTMVYVSAGGGGDRAAGKQLDAVISALRSETRHLLVGYGPLFRGAKAYGPGVTPVVEPEVWRFFPGMDAAVSAAGYNTYEELLAAGVPSVFYAQEKGLDAQQERVRQGAEAGWHRFVPRLDAELIAREMERLEDPQTQLVLREALRARGPQLGALRAAVELLATHATLEGSPVGRRQLLWCAAARAAWQPMSGVAFGAAFELMSTWFRATFDRVVWEEQVDRAVGAWGSEGGRSCSEDLGAWIRWGTKLARWRGGLGWPKERYKRMLLGAARQSQGRGASRASVLEELLEAIEEGQTDLRNELARRVDTTPMADMAKALGELAGTIVPSRRREADIEDEEFTVTLCEDGPEEVPAG